MNKTTSSNPKLKKKKKTSPSPNRKLDSIKKATPTCRNPLTDLNATRSNSQTHFTSINGSTNTSTSSSISVQTPKGCLSFFPSTKRFNKTPKSAPISKFRSKPPISHKPQPTRLLNKSENDKDVIFRDFNHTPCPISSPDVKIEHWTFSRSIDEDDNGEGTTPAVHKPGGSRKEDTTPPPVEPSISPEIQCGSSFLSNSSACFGAGHILSGVTDKRKCRPRGLLAVVEKKDLGLFNDGGSFVGFDTSRASLVPVPIDASMHWLSPTRVEENDQVENVENESTTPFSTPSSISGKGDSNRIFDLDSGGILGSEEGMSNKERGYLHESTAIKKSLSSGGDSFGSYNAVCTPKSDSSLDECVTRSSWFKNAKGSIFEFDLTSSVYSTPSLSPKNRPSKGDAADVLPLPGFSFQLSHSNRRSSHSIDQTQLQKSSNNSLVDSSYCRKSSHSHIGISWRDGLFSRMLEMEDLDCCRVFSDEEDELCCKVNENVVQEPIATDIAVPEKVVFKEPKTDDQQNVKVLHNLSSCAESISTEGGELTTSRDSDWDLCYKNQLFIE